MPDGSPTFVPLIGFRPHGSRATRDFPTATRDGARVRLLALAASPDRTDALVEWSITFDRAACPPIVSALMAKTPLDRDLTARLVTGGQALATTETQRLALSLGGAPDEPSRDVVRARHALSFPPLTQEGGEAELRVGRGAETWSLPFRLVEANPARPVTSTAKRDGITVSLTAMSRDGGQLVVGLEVEAPHAIRQVAAPVPTPPPFAGDDEDVIRDRARELRRVLGEGDPIVLVDGGGTEVAEIGRLLQPAWHVAATTAPYVVRCALVFPAPRPDTTRVAVLIPWVELNDLTHSVSADLRDVPVDLNLGPHHFRITAVVPSGDQRRVLVEVPPSSGSPRFIKPARIIGSNTEFSYGGKGGMEPVWMATAVGDPPVVTFQGSVIRFDGRWRLDLPV